ncbi:MAG: hypothetical protein BWY31_03233 [Lentisphaerae bacterium ADurb.Bin242]|nr:MAG: hypothetical protein BWY31_03233 [Lentisphaerae bacterium ADurb.Bin242]
MKILTWATTLAAGILVGIGCLRAAEAEPAAKNALVAGSPNYCDHFESILKPLGFKVVKIDKDNGEKNWKDKGYVLPAFEELKKYDLVVICPLANLLAGNKNDVVQYVNNGGTIFFLYNSLGATRAKSKELGYGICGFDGIKAVHLTPYPKAGNMKHNLKYAGKMGSKEVEQSLLYTEYATDLVDAEALLVNKDKPGMALATISRSGKGQFLFYGAENIDIVKDILKVAGFAK